MTQPKAIVDVDGLELTVEDKELLQHPGIAGMILFTRNYQSQAQLLALTQAVHEINPELMILVDQEGGRVQRFRDGFTSLNAMSTFGKQYETNPEAARKALQQQITTMLVELKVVGVTATLVPVLDLEHGHSEIIGERSFGKNFDVVTQLAEIVIDTLHQHGMPATLKHFPGHGYVAVDSHSDAPVDNRPFETVKNNDMKAFFNLLHKADYIMPAHIIFPEVDHRPVGFSPVWLKDILRAQMGFTGKIMTDDLSMQAAAAFGDYQARAEAAIDAGCDYLLVCNNRDGAIHIVETLEKRISVWH